jgi:hypothetical protein
MGHTIQTRMRISVVSKNAEKGNSQTGLSNGNGRTPKADISNIR